MCDRDVHERSGARTIMMIASRQGDTLSSIFICSRINARIRARSFSGKVTCGRTAILVRVLQAVPLRAIMSEYDPAGSNPGSSKH
jgi:hypothetical protein